MANTYLSRTPSSAGNRQTWTISAWVKRGTLGTYQNIVCSRSDANNALHLCFTDADQLMYQHYLGGSVLGELKTNRKFRDVNAWYNVVVTFDSTNATAGDRQKMYINGVEETSFATDTNIGQNQTSDWNDISNPMYIGQGGASNNYWTGSMSYVAFIDGTAEAPTIFGETDSTTGEWKIKTTITPSSSWGTNGFLILKDGNTGTDQSTNSNNFAVGGGTLTKTEDCPSNVFATWGTTYWIAATLTHGNTSIDTQASGNYAFNAATLGINKGKFYWENKITSTTTDMFGISGRYEANDVNNELGQFADQYAFVSTSGAVHNNDSDTSFTSAFNTNGNIVQIAFDCDNLKLYLGVNGTWQNSGDPTSGSTGTGAVSVGALSTTRDGVYFPAIGDWSSGSGSYETNFGNGYFGQDAVASAGTNASGIGIFEYDVPTGYTALCTKGLNE